MEITNTEVVDVKSSDHGVTVIARDRDGKRLEHSAQQLLLACGRKSNADLLMVENTGIKVDERGYIVVDEFFETSKKVLDHGVTLVRMWNQP
jgi:pyruvate/2-oxoglutarate dehydrogenase complex dihydrolipoamide dehydrogenase (E3) component